MIGIDNIKRAYTEKDMPSREKKRRFAGMRGGVERIKGVIRTDRSEWTHTSPRGVLQQRHVYGAGWQVDVTHHGAADEDILDRALDNRRWSQRSGPSRIGCIYTDIYKRGR